MGHSKQVHKSLRDEGLDLALRQDISKGDRNLRVVKTVSFSASLRTNYSWSWSSSHYDSVGQFPQKLSSSRTLDNLCLYKVYLM
jgi:hypothetical protein